MDTSPTKRRALASVDVNSRTPGAMSKLLEINKLHATTSQTDFGAVKRSLNQDSTRQPQQYLLEQPAKRRRVSVDDNITQPEGVYNERGDGGDSSFSDIIHNGDYELDSPNEDSSMFDNSTADTTQDTTIITEPDAEIVVAPLPPILSPPRRQPSMTREEARRKAEKLRLRLGLAGYKVRTGQTDVPLEQLKVKRLSGSTNTGSNLGQHHDGQPSLPPLPYTDPTPDEVEAEKRDDAEDESQQRNRLAVMARKALPRAPLPRQESSLEVSSSPPGRKPLPSLPSSTPQRAQ